jgi:hypothetical protein
MEFSRQGSENYSGFPREVVISAWKFQGIGSEKPLPQHGGADINWNNPLLNLVFSCFRFPEILSFIMEMLFGVGFCICAER